MAPGAASGPWRSQRKKIASTAFFPNVSKVRIVKTIAAMQRLSRHWQQSGKSIALVPTMGYLHQGHLSLIHRARKWAGPKGQVVVSIFVNPTQFGPHEDLSKYPRDLKRDKKLCAHAGADVVFVPSAAGMYPAGFSTWVTEEKLSRPMEGAARPTHFRGVTTVVSKLFNIVQPGAAIFGMKDFQQSAVMRRMVRDLNFPVKIIVAPTMREPDGLAMSSRNKYLTAAQRRQATVLYRSIRRAQSAAAKNRLRVAQLTEDLRRFIASEPEAHPDYIAIFHPDTLEPLRQSAKGAHLALAVFVGKTRLIDNGPL